MYEAENVASTHQSAPRPLIYCLAVYASVIPFAPAPLHPARKQDGQPTCLRISASLLPLSADLSGCALPLHSPHPAARPNIGRARPCGHAFFRGGAPPPPEKNEH